MKLLFAILGMSFLLVLPGMADLPIEFGAKVDDALMTELDGITRSMLRGIDTTDAEADRQTKLRSKVRVYELGAEADMAYAALIVRALAHTENQPPPEEWQSSSRLPHLIRSMRNTPAVAPYLSPALREWLQYLADGKSGYLYPVAAEEAAIYLLYYGGDSERPFLERITSALLKKEDEDPNRWTIGKTLKNVLDGNGRNDPSVTPTVALHQWCGNYVERAYEGLKGKLHIEGVDLNKFVELRKSRKAVEERQEKEILIRRRAWDAKSQNASVGSAIPMKDGIEWKAWLAGVAIAALALGSWLFIRRRREASME